METSKKHIDVDSVLETIHSQLENIKIDSGNVFIVKSGNKYVSKGSADEIRSGKRYKLSETPYRFFKEVEAQEAARLFKGIVSKE